MSVGVVIPTYERVAETVRAVESVLAQTSPVDQLVVVDDGSGGEAVEQLAAALDALAVPLVRAPHTGHPGKARNLGVAQLTTRWVAFLDSDDSWAPDKLEKQLALAAESGCDAVCTNAYRVVDGQLRGSLLPALPPEPGLDDLLRDNIVINSSVVVSRTVLAGVGGVASSYFVRGCEDYATWLRVATSHRWAAIDEPLVHYTDAPAVSIRGTEEFSHHPGQQAAWLDYVNWRRQTGSPLVQVEQLVGAGLQSLLLAETSPPHRPAPPRPPVPTGLVKWFPRRGGR